MKDVNGNEIKKGDWIIGVGWVPYGKVTKVEEHKAIFVPDEGEAEQELTEEEVKERAVVIYMYSSIRNRHLKGKIPDDFLTLSTPQENAASPIYTGIMFFQGLIEDILEVAGKLPDEGKVYLENIDGYLAKVQVALTEHADEEDFCDDMREWFVEHM